MRFDPCIHIHEAIESPELAPALSVCSQYLPLFTSESEAVAKSNQRISITVTMSTSVASITSTSPQDWKYISEGAANVVFSYNGDPHRNPYFNGKVLRLRKSASTVIPGFPLVDQLDDSDEPDDPIIEFQHKIIQRLIPSEYLPRLASISVEASWLQDLAKLCESERPSHRRQKDGIDLTRTKAVLATDLVGTDALAVEIKASSVVELHRLLYRLTSAFLAEMGFSTVTDSSLDCYFSD
jgi:hypothetical protein